MKRIKKKSKKSEILKIIKDKNNRNIEKADYDNGDYE